MNAATESKPMPAPPKTASAAMILTLGLVSLISGLLVVYVFETTKPMIEANKQELIERALFQVVPKGAVQRRDYVATDAGIVPAAEADGKKGVPFYAAYDAQGKLVGVAVESAAQGYADLVRVLFGIDPHCQCITGNYILKSAETPGLGDKIFTDKGFLANFKALDVTVAGDTLAHPVVAVKHGSKKNPWEIDAISGATVSSTAVAKALDRGAQHLMPKLMPHLKEIERIEVKKEEGSANERK
ncbi:FMN-binding protein [Endothiovibrio diazotrophicus]